MVHLAANGHFADSASFLLSALKRFCRIFQFSFYFQPQNQTQIFTPLSKPHILARNFWVYQPSGSLKFRYFMTVVCCPPLTANNHYEQNSLFTVQTALLHPSDGSVICLYSVSTHRNMSVCSVWWKNWNVLYCMLLEHSFWRYRIAVIWKVYKNWNVLYCMLLEHSVWRYRIAVIWTVYKNWNVLYCMLLEPSVWRYRIAVISKVYKNITVVFCVEV